MESFLNPEIKNVIIDENFQFQDSVSSSSSESDSFEEVNSSFDPLQDMSCLLQQLPIKRGLSEHYNGKSQSFTCLSNLNCLEELAKPENPYNKKLKSCKSDGRILEMQSPRKNTGSRQLIAKKTSRRSCGRRDSRPPMAPPYRSTSFTNQTPLFA
ncbi:uncharacterized protein Fot_26036 [Forsythia ovata]|uniref:Uncharacterized protein n=1 Tax=Forsythia ovata TaxID=205694 RepID=A0ABD1UBI4_9LAMI